MTKRNSCILILCVLAFGVKGQRQVTGFSGDLKARMIYLSEVVNEYRQVYQVIDSAAVRDGKFIFTLENVNPGLYFMGDAPEHGGYFFLDGKKIELTPERVTDENVVWKVTGSPLDKVYREFERQLYVVTHRQKRDSLDDCFMKAREADNRKEMAGIKEESMPYYEQGRVNEGILADQFIEKNRKNALGMSLYYNKKFQFKDFQTVESIEQEKAYVARFGKSAKDTRYTTLIAEKLELFENCAIGHVAPEIVGKDTSGNPVHLSDLRGNYVLVDFWNSYCHWCREETPALKRALERFKDKNFKILGVSSDFYKEKWTDAIHEDGSYWNHLMLQKGNRVMDRYCIKGIPHIILIGPDGKILAKNLRGQELITVSEKFIK